MGDCYAFPREVPTNQFEENVTSYMSASVENRVCLFPCGILCGDTLSFKHSSELCVTIYTINKAH
jgi:hypothetical protein